MNTQEADQLTLDGALPQEHPDPPIHCHGDARVDELRIARTAFNRTLTALRGLVARARYCVDYMEAGVFFEGLVDDLEGGDIESLTARFGSWGHQGIETIKQARDDEKDPDGYPIPEPDTWKDLEALGTALIEHGKTVRQLAKAESAALPRSLEHKKEGES